MYSGHSSREARNWPLNEANKAGGMKLIINPGISPGIRGKSPRRCQTVDTWPDDEHLGEMSKFTSEGYRRQLKLVR